MFPRTRTALLGLCLICGTAGAQEVADGSLYWGIGGTAMRWVVDDPALRSANLDTWHFGGGTVRLGLEPHPRLALELRAGTAGGDTRHGVDTLGNSLRLRVETEYFAAALARLNVTTGRARLYLLGGVGHAKLMETLEVNGAREYRVTEDETTPAWGAGLELYGNRNVAVYAEWLRLLQDDDPDYYLDAASLGVTYHY